jgi:hypothetical protein
VGFVQDSVQVSAVPPDSHTSASTEHVEHTPDDPDRDIGGSAAGDPSEISE